MKAGWEVKALGELCEIAPKKALAKKAIAESAMVSFVPMERLGELERNFDAKEDRALSSVYKGYTYFADGDVIIAKITPCFENGKMGIVTGMTNGIGFGSSEFVPLRGQGKILPEFLFYFLLRDEFREEGARVMTGAVGHKRVPKDYLETLQVPLPPLDEQKRIVAVLDAAFEGLTRARTHVETNLQNARELFAQGVEALFARIEPSDLKQMRLGSIVTRLTNGYVGPTRNIYQESGVPYLLARHVKNNRLRFDGKTFVSDEFNQKHKKSMLKAGDVLLVQSGHIGHCAVVPESHQGDNCHAMIVLSAMPDILTGHYLSAVLNTPAQQREFQKIRTGSTVPHLTCKLVKEMKLPVPTLHLQDRLVAEIDNLRLAMDKIERNYTNKLQDLDDLRQSLLQKAFAGELT